ncbi:MAG: choline dehydrogenase-like flavoprotein [Limisphaerales bacterium]
MTEFDAIVVGSGMSGGFSAKELAERGLKVLVLERGQNIDPKTDYVDLKPPWEKPNFDLIAETEVDSDYPIQHRGVAYAVKESNKHFWVKDSEHPYTTEPGTDYDWLRGYHLGGRSVTWARQSYRLSPMDFESNKRDGYGEDWPVRYDDIEKWYDHVETFAGISGAKESLPQLPDSQFQPPFAMTDAEKSFKSRVETTFPGRRVINARVAHLTAPTKEQIELGRAPCQARNICAMGCSFKAYFSSLNATLPAATRTGNCTIKTDAIVSEVIYDPDTQRVTGVKVIDQHSRQRTTYTAKMVFLNASAIGSALILMNSKSTSFPQGLANTSGQLGRNLMDHVSSTWAMGTISGFEHLKSFGRRPGGFYIPRYANVTENDKPFLRGFGFQGGSGRINALSGRSAGIGEDYKARHKQPGPWYIRFGAFGEVLPNPDNRVSLNETKTDKWGLPLAHFNCQMGKNEVDMMREARTDAIAMLKAAGCTDIVADERDVTLPGNRIHEMGSARMGRDPATSVLNGWCQSHDVSNLFVSDGSFMASSGCQNPSLTYMAFAARAAHYAADQLADGNI